MNQLGKLLSELKQTAQTQNTQSPDWWLDKAQMLSAMWMDVKEEKTKYEMAYKKEKVEYIEKGDSVASANLKVEATSENYRLYLYCKGKDEQIAEIIKIAKKRVDATPYGA